MRKAVVIHDFLLLFVNANNMLYLKFTLSDVEATRKIMKCFCSIHYFMDTLNYST